MTEQIPKYGPTQEPETVQQIVDEMALATDGATDETVADWVRRLRLTSISAHVGPCGTCKFRDATGHCRNEKLAEDWGQNETEKADMLVYDYSESGGFWVGEQFGCVHYAAGRHIEPDATCSICGERHGPEITHPCE